MAGLSPTTKELVAAVLGTRYALLKNEGNLNSEIGLPVVLLELTRKHQLKNLEEIFLKLTGDVVEAPSAEAAA